jgi:hypothetical protein
MTMPVGDLPIDAPERPDPERALARLKDFQRKTVDHVFERLFLRPDSTHRFLVADEVGLGKTLVARGVITKALDHLWDRVERVDVVYICSNQDIARQNIRRLNVLTDEEIARTTRLTLLPTELSGLRGRKVNFVSFTPATSLDLASQMGRMEERVLLYWMLNREWGLGTGQGPKNVMQGNAGADNFRYQIECFERGRIDRTIQESFHVAIAARDHTDRAVGRPTLRERFNEGCAVFARFDSLTTTEQRGARSQLIGDLRRVLAATCIRQLQPDLVILDEFQRFKELLHGESEAALLAQELFDYQDGDQRARVLLLSATPYKMYTVTDESGGDDHYRDFVDTLRFLLNDPATVSGVAARLAEMRRALLRGREGAAEVATLKREIEAVLRKVIVRTERLAVSADRSGMLREIPAAAMSMKPDDARAYCALQDVSDALEQHDATEYWKAAPFLLNMMDEYELKRRLRRSLGDEGRGARVATAIRQAEKRGVPLLLPREVIETQRPLEVPHARMRWMIEDVLDRGTWKLLWLPPSYPYYRPGGPFAEPALAGFTKRLVFSAWRVVPKAIATMVSYEAERRMLEGTRRPGEPLGEQIERLKGPLKFTRSGQGRLTGMPVVALLYPSIELAAAGDPLHVDLSGIGAAAPSHEEVIAAVMERLRPLVDSLVQGAASQGAVDESWYWAAPLLLDLERRPKAARAWLCRDDLAAAWTGNVDDDPEEHSGWRDHVARFATMLVPSGRAELGPPPDDLLRVLAELAVAGPAVCALRALSRSREAERLTGDVRVRDAAGIVAHGFRALFNLPEVISVIRGISTEEPYWRRVLEYATWGNLQAVLDEYLHVMPDVEGLIDGDPAAHALPVAAKVREAMGVRTARLGVDDIRVAGNGDVQIQPGRLRSRFAMRFGEEKDEERNEVTRADVVRRAFNSPFWPFVLASTSVGQEGLDFHLYCHAVVHWNLPSNPVDMEQREGRVHRFKGHAVRKNVAARFGREVMSDGSEDPWGVLFELAKAYRSVRDNDLVPYWVYAHPRGAVIERHVPSLPLSRDVTRHQALRRSLALYRMVFGQPRQDELVEYLASLGGDSGGMSVDDLRIDLSPDG